MPTLRPTRVGTPTFCNATVCRRPQSEVLRTRAIIAHGIRLQLVIKRDAIAASGEANGGSG